MKLKPVSSKRSSRLSDSDARVRGDVKSGAALEKASQKETARISNLQRVFYADARHALLIVLQGRDASGKDGTIRKVFSAVNPQGCSVSASRRRRTPSCITTISGGSINKSRRAA